MRKFIITLMILMLCLNMAIGVHAAEEMLSIPDVSAQQGQTIYVAVTLTESVMGDAMGVTYSYDKAVLEAIPSSSTWGKQGMLQDFSRTDSGVWAVGQVQDLKGTVCVLAFRVKDGVSLTETEVTCTVTVKNDADTVGTYTATGKITAACDHKFAAWESDGELIHSQTCELCGHKQAQTHVWNDGVVSDHPTDEQKDLLTFTCTICGATRQQEIADQASGQQPTMPTHPTEAPEESDDPVITTFPPDAPETATRPPQHEENNESTRPTQGTNSQNGQTGNQGNSGNQSGSGQLTDYNQGAGNNQNSGESQKPGSNQGDSGNQSGQDGQTGTADGTHQDEHDHVHEEDLDSIAIPIPEGAVIPEELLHPDHTHPAATEPTHDHVHETPAPEQTGISLLALLLAASLVVGAVVLVTVLMKRIKRK